ncbi:enoyl-CoA hydratase/isomerase family protein [Bradyrhizobium ivorense]|uniref:enoyl-CoA hydratase/isomerase family protein n=1 Tax=Bradyrhizobium ivorense TaxID=2511166 RepID=UPI0010B17735|nr:enoyl-CoA hydratase/isomerase family protein [Bradyrhizobium ivorense]VIO71679.1 Short-chain-enoyl-CoA hydratase [Bradyrhizobium ivorense]
MAYSTILYEADDRVAWITLNRPDKMNAMSVRLEAEFQDALEIADNDPDVRVVVISGAGGRAFSAGFDFGDEDEAATGEVRRTIDDWGRRMKKDVKFLNSPFNCSKPVIAMINGYCLAGALELAQMCDMRYCSDDARFGFVESRFAAGLPNLAIMPWIMGQRCRELIYTGDMFDAQEAFRLGLMNRVYPKEQLEEEVTRIAKRMSRVAMPTLVWSKKALNNTLLAAGFDSALQYSAQACLIMDVSESEFKHFRKLQETEGVAAAIKWRDSLFAPFESEKSWKKSAKK